MENRSSFGTMNRPWLPGSVQSSEDHGGQYSDQLSENGLEFKNIDELAADFIIGTEHLPGNHSLFTVYRIYRPDSCQSPLDLVIVIGNTMGSLHVLVWCDVGSTALPGFLLWPESGQSIREHIRSIAYHWGFRLSSSLQSAVQFSGDLRYIYWDTLRNGEGYHYQRLLQTKAGKVLLELQQYWLYEGDPATVFSMLDVSSLQIEESTTQRSFTLGHVIGQSPSCSQTLALGLAIETLSEGQVPCLRSQKSASQSLRAGLPGSPAVSLPASSSCYMAPPSKPQIAIQPAIEPSMDYSGDSNRTRPLSPIAPGPDFFDIEDDEQLPGRWFCRLLNVFTSCAFRS